MDGLGLGMLSLRVALSPVFHLLCISTVEPRTPPEIRTSLY